MQGKCSAPCLTASLFERGIPVSNVSVGTFGWDKTSWPLQALRSSSQSGFLPFVDYNFTKTPIPDHCRVLHPISLGGSNWYQRCNKLVDLAVSNLFSLSCLLCLLLLSLIFQQTMIQSCRIFNLNFCLHNFPLPLRRGLQIAL